MINTEFNYDVWGMRRVGNHAIIEWIAQHFERTLHRNDIIQEKPWVIKEYGDGKYYDCHIDSYEDFAPAFQVVKDNTIILLRDWYNVSASRLFSGRGWHDTCRFPDKKDYIRSCEEVYIEYCKLWEQHPEKFILYNKWATDENYEIEIEKRYGWNRSKRIQKLPKSGIGRGSSFGDESSLNLVNERFMKIANEHPHIWEQMIDNDEINKYNEQIFGLELK